MPIGQGTVTFPRMAPTPYACLLLSSRGLRSRKGPCGPQAASQDQHMETLNLRSMAAECLGKSVRSVKRDLLAVFSDDHPRTRSVRRRLELIRDRPLVRVAVVLILDLTGQNGIVVDFAGAAPNLQRDLDNADDIYQTECRAWVHIVDVIGRDRPELRYLDYADSDDEDELFELGRDLGASIVGYYVDGASFTCGGFAEHPKGRRGFWVGSCATEWSFAHELTHIVGDNGHVCNDKNLMLGNRKNRPCDIPAGTGNIVDPPPDLTQSQCAKILDDPEMKRCD